MAAALNQRASQPAVDPYRTLFKVCFFAVFFTLSCVLIHRLVYAHTTIKLHIDYTKYLAQGVQVLPHLGYFYALLWVQKLSGLSYEISAVILISFFATLTAIEIYILLQKFLPQCSTIALLAMTTVLMTVAAIYVPFFNRAVYFGQGSPSMWHNSTVIAVKFFAILGFYVVVRFLEDEHYQNSLDYCMGMAVVMLLSVLVKPTFLLVFVPAVGLYILIRHTTQFDLYWKIFLIMLPACLLLAFQHTTFYASATSAGSAGRTIGFVPFAVWRMFTPNIPVSILITIAFPLAVLVFNFRGALGNRYLSASWLVMLVGMLQFALLAEVDSRGQIMSSANWIGGYLIGLTLLFLFSMIEFAKWIQHRSQTGGAEQFKISFTFALLALHTVSGGFYLYELFSNRETTLIFYS